MKKTFVCDNSMIITIPIGSLNDARMQQIMPEKFHCVFRDSFKVFALKGRPKPLGAAQALAGMLVIVLGLIFTKSDAVILFYTCPSVLFLVCGMLTYAAGQFPNMHLAKLSFAMNILGLFWSITAVILCGAFFQSQPIEPMSSGIKGVILTLMAVESFFACFLIYWQSKAVCKDHFNTLPVILLKQTD